MNARARSVVVVLALVATATACGHESATVRGPSTTTTARALVVPMVRETALPIRPPAVDLQFAPGPTQPGVRYATDFRLRDAVTTRAPLWPVPWPAPVVVAEPAAAAVVVHSTARPDDVTVKSWSRLVPDHRVPDPHSAEPGYECERFSAPTCAFTRHGAQLRLVLPARVVRSPYVAIYLQWHIPHAQQLSGSFTSSDATATWLFRVEASGS